jgi:RsiW-degrading membrane proteinase PrsW (M82 family)
MLELIAFILFGVVIYLFILLIIKRDRGSKEPTGALMAAVGFGFLALAIAGVLNSILLPKEVMEGIGQESLKNVPTSTLFWSAMTVGLIEEAVKCLPLAFFIYKKRYFNELTDGVIYFGIVGLTFGIIEDIFYTIEFGGAVGLARVISAPYLHAGFTILFGICLIQRKLLKRSWLFVAGGFLLAVLAHGFYDFAAFSGTVLGMLFVILTALSLSLLIFAVFRHAQKIDELHGKSAVGINKFCRNCGRPNPERLLYCRFCGKHS